ncbi:hypothetical protein [Azospirillum sp. sgz301742]
MTTPYIQTPDGKYDRADILKLIAKFRDIFTKKKNEKGLAILEEWDANFRNSRELRRNQWEWVLLNVRFHNTRPPRTWDEIHSQQVTPEPEKPEPAQVTMEDITALVKERFASLRQDLDDLNILTDYLLQRASP